MRNSFLFLLLAALLSASLSAQTLEELRGGWIADFDGAHHIYYIVLRNNAVSGVYCSDCDSLNGIAFIDDGELTDSGLNFTLYHYPDEVSSYQETVEAQLQNGELQMLITSADGSKREAIFQRVPEEEKVFLPIAAFRMNQPATGSTRTLPSIAEPVSVASVTGMWLWGSGPAKQYFFFREHKGGVRGMVCGPCDSVFDMAPLEQITLQGTNFHFEIVHEDNGGGFAQNGPHSNVTDAIISKNELHMNTHASYAEPGSGIIEMTLLGPIKAGAN